MNELPPAPPAALDENAPERKSWAKPEIQELDHELTRASVGTHSDGNALAYSQL